MDLNSMFDTFKELTVIINGGSERSKGLNC